MASTAHARQGRSIPKRPVNSSLFFGGGENNLSEAILFIVFFSFAVFFLQGKDGPVESLKQIMKITIHGNLRGPPQCHPPPRNKALLRDY